MSTSNRTGILPEATILRAGFNVEKVKLARRFAEDAEFARNYFAEAAELVTDRLVNDTQWEPR